MADQAAADEPVQWFHPGGPRTAAPALHRHEFELLRPLLEPGLRSDLYPSVRDYYRQLLEERLGYEITLDVSTPAPPRWAYPKRIDFLENRLVVLERTRPAPS